MQCLGVENEKGPGLNLVPLPLLSFMVYALLRKNGGKSNIYLLIIKLYQTILDLRLSAKEGKEIEI
jgi:hypothetical protein